MKLSLLFVVALLSACASRPKPPVYSGDTYSPKRAEAFTLNFFLVVSREADSVFKVEVSDRQTGKKLDLGTRDLKVYWKSEDNLQEILGRSGNSFTFRMERASDCWGGVFGFVIGDPRKAVQKTTANLLSICEANL